MQGALGRFGAVELSDVAVFVELPDGKVLSGSEAGNLLLWEGGFIKAVISRWVTGICRQAWPVPLYCRHCNC
jgi:hypothetical protein